MVVTALDHFVLRVRDLDRSLAFYRDVLGLPVLFLDEFRAGKRPFVSVRIGRSLLDLVPDSTYDPAAGLTAGGFMHFCLRVADGSLIESIDRLRDQGVEIVEDGPTARMGATGMGLSIYTRDPDGYIVEIKEDSGEAR